MTETNAKPIEPTCSMCPSYPRIQAELDRLTAECQKWQEYHDAEYRERKKYRHDANYFAGEVDRLRAELKEREGECERLRDAMADSNDTLLREFDSNAVGHTDLYTWIKCILKKIERLKSLAAARLADQEAIERHVSKRVAREILLIMDGSESYEDAVSEIRKKYEVD